MNSNEKEINGLEIEEQTTPEQVAQEEKLIAEEEIAEEIAENAEEMTLNEQSEDFEDEITDETVGEDNEEVLEENPEEISEEAYEEVVADEPVKKGNKGVIIGVVAAILVVAITVVTLFLTGVIGGNKYNKLGYPNVSGRTINDIAVGANIQLDAFLEMYDLPKDMPGDTEEMNALYHMPANMYLETMYGIDFATMKAALNIPDKTTPLTNKTFFDKVKGIFVKEEILEINEKTPWYIVEGELTVGDFSGGKVDEFKEFYGLDADVTEQTKIKEINKQINKSIREKLKEQEEAAAEAEKEKKEEATAKDTETSAKTEQTENAEQNPEEKNSEVKSEE